VWPALIAISVLACGHTTWTGRDLYKSGTAQHALAPIARSGYEAGHRKSFLIDSLWSRSWFTFKLLAPSVPGWATNQRLCSNSMLAVSAASCLLYSHDSQDLETPAILVCRLDFMSKTSWILTACHREPVRASQKYRNFH
jgi:hypothetical protein